MTTATETKPTAKTANPNGATPDVTRNLYQRLAAITAEVGSLKATGKTAYGQKAVSIEDVEDAIRELSAKHGVVTGYRWNTKPETTGKEGNQSLWLADLTVWLVNVDKADDSREDHLFDVGTSPSAAVSFALKRYYKALFHLADEEDEQRSTPTNNGGSRQESAGNGAPASALNEDQALEITALNNSLPKPYAKPVTDAMARSGYGPGRTALVKAHQLQCGEGCEHLAKP